MTDIGRKISISKDHQFYWKHIDDIEVYQDKGKAIREIFSPYEKDTRSWHTKASNLFSLLDQQYIIKLEQWYGEYQCSLSHYGQDKEKLGILCLDKPPTQNEIDTFLTLNESPCSKLTGYHSHNALLGNYFSDASIVEFFRLKDLPQGT